MSWIVSLLRKEKTMVNLHESIGGDFFEKFADPPIFKPFDLALQLTDRSKRGQFRIREIKRLGIAPTDLL